MFCNVCGFNHGALSVEITSGELVRRVLAENQRVRAFGGGYGFTPKLWDRHARDFDRVKIIDLARNEIWRGDVNAIMSARRETLHPAIGEQVIVLCSRMNREIDGEIVQAPPVERAVIAQSALVSDGIALSQARPVFGQAPERKPRRTRGR